MGAVVGDHGVAIGKALTGLGSLHNGRTDFPDDLLVRSHLLNRAGIDQHVPVWKELHIVGVPVGEIPEGRAVFLKFDHLAGVMIGGVDVNLGARSGCGKGGDKKKCGCFEHGKFFSGGVSIGHEAAAQCATPQALDQGGKRRNRTESTE